MIICSYCQGCIDALEEHLPALIPFLVQSMSDKKVRGFDCLGEQKAEADIDA